MISRDNLDALKDEGIHYIIGTRMRKNKELKDEVLSSPGRYQTVRSARNTSSDSAPLKVKNVQVDGTRYVVCLNEEEAEAEKCKREVILKSLRKKLLQGSKQLVGNKGYRRYLKKLEGAFEIDESKIQEEARYDGKYVLQTTLSIPACEVALRYKDLYRVERVMRQIKDALSTRPVYHQNANNIRGHVFCSFLALKLIQALEVKLNARDSELCFEQLKDELNEVYTSEVKIGKKRFAMRSEVESYAAESIRAVGAKFDQKIVQLN
jgi:transposase